MSYDPTIAEQIRDHLSGRSDVREVKMFGGLTFMVNEKMTATANTHGDLMVRCDPDRAEMLLEKPGAGWPSMRGRQMSKGWIVVSSENLNSDADYAMWLDEALAYNREEG